MLVPVHTDAHWHTIELNLVASVVSAPVLSVLPFGVKVLQARCIHSQTRACMKFACTHIPTLSHY